MKHHEFLNQLEEDRVAAAIARAELKSSGEIRVFVSRQKTSDVMASAQREFDRLGLRKTRERNGVMLYFAPVSQQFAILGDNGIHQKCGDSFWQEARDAMSSLLKQGQFTEAILAGVNRVGDLLAKHFPRQSDDQNELPDTIARD